AENVVGLVMRREIHALNRLNVVARTDPDAETYNYIVTGPRHMVDKVRIRRVPDLAKIQVMPVGAIEVCLHLYVGSRSQHVLPVSPQVLPQVVAVVLGKRDCRRRKCADAQLLPRNRSIRVGRERETVLLPRIPVQAETRPPASPVVKISAVRVVFRPACEAL